MIVASKYNVYQQNIFSRMKAMDEVCPCAVAPFQAGIQCISNNNINTIDREQQRHQQQQQEVIEELSQRKYSDICQAEKKEEEEASDNIADCSLERKRSNRHNHIIPNNQSGTTGHYACRSFDVNNSLCPSRQRQQQQSSQSQSQFNHNQKRIEEAAIKQHQQHHYYLFHILLPHLSLKPSSLKCLVKYFGWLHIRSTV